MVCCFIVCVVKIFYICRDRVPRLLGPSILPPPKKRVKFTFAYLDTCSALDRAGGSSMQVPVEVSDIEDFIS